MKCPNCSASAATATCRVIDRRDVPRSNAIRRRRRCLGCGHRWSTCEVVLAPEDRSADVAAAIAAGFHGDAVARAFTDQVLALAKELGLRPAQLDEAEQPAA